LLYENKKAELRYRKDDRAMRPIYGCSEIEHFLVPEYAYGYFSRKFQWAFVLIDPINVRTKFEVRNFTRS